MSMGGYWGEVTSSVDWCELNYIWSIYVAEWWNSVSSFGMVFVGLAGIYLHYYTLERRFLLAFFLVALLGFGSVLFHASLKHATQMCDEVPMLYAVLATSYILLENEPNKAKFGPYFPVVLIAWATFTSLLTIMAEGDIQFVIFHLSFASAELFSIYRVWRIYQKYKNFNIIHSQHTATGKQLNIRKAHQSICRLFRLGIASYASAIVCWVLDLTQCEFFQVTLATVSLPNPQLHSWWHILVSLGFYFLITVTALDRQLVLYEFDLEHYDPPIVKWWANCLPFIASKQKL